MDSKAGIDSESKSTEIEDMSNNGPAVNGPQPKPEKYLKVSLYLRKLPEISDEYFHGYWRNNHLVPAFANDTFMSKVRKYSQVCPFQYA